MIRCMDPPLRI